MTSNDTVEHHRFTYTDKPSTGVIEALASVEGKDPVDSEPLVNSIDVDALDNLFSPTQKGNGTRSGTISFTIREHSIIVSSNGEITVTA